MAERKDTTQDKFGQRETYLSSNVAKLVCYKPQASSGGSNEEMMMMFDGGISQWLKNETLSNLKEKCCATSDICDYRQAVTALHPLSSAIQDHLLKFTPEEFYEKYKWQLEWTNKSVILLRSFELLKSPSDDGSLLAALLLLTATLERLLGDIYLSCFSEMITRQCPSLLKDLLQTPELEDVLGKTFMFCLQVYIGPPSGLNLRNLAWHGFLSHGELQPIHVSFLLACALALAEEVQKHSRNKRLSENLENRSLIKYSHTSLLQNVFPTIEPDHLATLFHASSFVTSSMRKMWDLAISFYQQGRFGEVVMVMLPQLEHSLRRIYASSNNLEERLSTAESAEFYTTFNEILSPTLADNTANQLVDVIGPCFLEMLLDILVHKEGPRLRDHTSHGEVDMQDFPKHLAGHVLNIAAAFCQKFSCNNESASYSKQQNKDLSSVVENYSSLYHPVSCLQGEYLFLVNQLLQWKALPKPSDNEFVCSDEENMIYITSCERIIQNVFLLNKTTSGCSSASQTGTGESNASFNETVFRNVKDILSKTKSPTLFRPRHELEIASLLRNIVSQCLQVSTQILHVADLRYGEWSERKLRSRQRQNYKRFWLYLPFIEKTMLLMLVILLSELICLPNDVRYDQKHTKFLKRCLQFVENLVSLSSLSKNRWQECVEIGRHFVAHAHKNYEHNNEMVATTGMEITVSCI